MTLAAVSQSLIDLGIYAGVFSAVTGAVVILWRTPPIRWCRRLCSAIFDLFVGMPLRVLAARLGVWFRSQVQEANAEHYEYVRYHLGPNGTTKPVHQRLCDVERAVGIDDRQTPDPFVDWNGPYDDV